MSENPAPFIIHRPADGRVSAAVFDSPHSGTYLPPDFAFQASDADRAFLRDSYVHLLLAGAPLHGVPVLENLTERLLIDPNSDEDEIDPAWLRDAWPLPYRLTRNITEKRLGLITTHLRTPHGTLSPIFNAHTKPTAAQIIHRIENYYRPYRKTLGDLLEAAHQCHGHALHFNFHSMPRQKAPINADIILGNRNGLSASKTITACVRDFFEQQGLSVHMNAPYPGGGLTRKFGDPSRGYHSLQVEIARDLYMDTDTLVFDTTKGQRIADIMTALSHRLSLAKFP
jgi:N-formylglutamate deformylase